MERERELTQGMNWRERVNTRNELERERELTQGMNWRERES